MVNDGNFLNTDDIPEKFLDQESAYHFFLPLPVNETLKEVFGITENFVRAKAASKYKDILIYDDFWDEDNDKPILPTYKTNSYGYRSEDWSHGDPGIVTIGCSDTFGIGQFNDRIWPTLLSKKLNTTSYNLGWPGVSLDYCYKVLKRYLPEINTNYVFLLTPSIEKLEFYYNDLIGTVSSGGLDELNSSFPLIGKNQAEYLKKYYLTYYIERRNIIVNYNKNLDAIKQVCADNKVKLYTLMNPETGSLGHKKYFYELFPGHSKGYKGVREYDLAIDCIHRGKIWHWMIAEYFADKMME